MGSITKKTIAMLAIFFIVPLVAIAVNWHWQPASLNQTSLIFYYITETASFPWAAITSLVLFGLFCLFLPSKTKRKLMVLWIILTSAILVGQIIKSGIKSYVAESRPFVMWMEQEYGINDSAFYALPKAERKMTVNETLNQSTIIPNWLVRHWGNETGYAFPSGHTLFATTWAFLAILFLGFRRHYISVSAITLWAVLIEISRLALGMHTALDLIFGTLLACIIALVCYFCAKKWHVVE